MAYAQPRRIKRNLAKEYLDTARIHGNACLRWIEQGDEERAREQAVKAASMFFKADRLKKVRV